ncbi:MAG: insulinase family protein [Deltaproteobacteria bacterium]|nr:insulinase family protein [Deltaproteobacteria bacterium]
MPRRTVACCVALLLLAGRDATASPLGIPHERFRLKNGLDVILHADRRLPRVVVHVLYRVGSRNEPAGRSGAAHLFEHLMFSGSQNVPEKQIDQLMERAGGWNNAYTSEDMTVYYDVGPSRLLERLLWIEADRMATLPLALTQRKLDLQREVVLNERRQNYENAPYGVAQLLLPTLLYPKGHPYSWPVIGSPSDLRAVTLRDVQELFRRFYTPRNASLVVAGDFEPAHARRLVERYFAWIPAPPPVDAPHRAPVSLRRPVQRTVADRVKTPRLYLAWLSPPALTPGDAELDLAAMLLAEGRRSRLHQALVYERQVALDVEARQDSGQLASTFVVEVTARPGVSRTRLLRVVERELARFLAAPPTALELERVKNQVETAFVAGLQRVQRRAELLNRYLALTGQPDYLGRDLARFRRATPEAVHAASRRVIDLRRRVQLWVVPAHGAAE